MGFPFDLLKKTLKRKSVSAKREFQYSFNRRGGNLHRDLKASSI